MSDECKLEKANDLNTNGLEKVERSNDSEELGQTLELPIVHDKRLDESGPRDITNALYLNAWLIGYPDSAWNLDAVNLSPHNLSTLEMLGTRDKEDEEALKRIFRNAGCRNVDLNGSMVVIGAAYGRAGIPDGAVVITSPVVAIDKVGYDMVVETLRGRTFRAPGAVFVIKTATGSSYYAHEYYYRIWIDSEQYYPF